MKQVQIPETLFGALVKYHLMDMPELLPEITKGLEEKLDRMVMREFYSQYKTASTEEEKQKTRKPEKSIWTGKEYRRSFDGNSS